MTANAVGQQVLITGASGYLGHLLVEALVADPGKIRAIVAMDIRPPSAAEPRVRYLEGDIRDAGLAEQLRRHEIDTVVHLAAVVTPGRGMDRSFLYSVDVLGTQNVLAACLAAKTSRLIITTSGAGYGYHADNPAWLVETDPLRGNVEFAYSDHKRQVEALLARYRREHPELEQLIFRPGTILGRNTSNQITDLFGRRVLIGLRGSDSPFVLIWDQDMVRCLLKGIREGQVGIYNVAGDGVLTLREMAVMMGKPYVPLPVAGVRHAMTLMKLLKITQYGPEQVDFLRYRPVLCNRALKEDFGYQPQKTTRQVFEFFLQSRRGS